MADSPSEDLSKYVRAPTLLLKSGRPLEVNLYLYLPYTKSIDLYKSATDRLAHSDLDSLAQIPRENILIARKDQFQLIRSSASQIAQSLNEPNPDYKQIASGASSILFQIGLPGGGDQPASPEQVQEALNSAVASIEATVLNQFRKTPSVQAYGEVLKNLTKSPDRLTEHCQQVSAIAILIALSVDRYTAEDVAHIGTAGLLHDLGLRQIPAGVTEKYLAGSEQSLAPDEKLIYMHHPQKMAEQIRENKMEVAPTVLTAIEQHHECWDGSGFKGLTGANICHPARILGIANEIVLGLSALSHGPPPTVKEIIQTLASLKGKAQRPVFDPDILLCLIQMG